MASTRGNTHGRRIRSVEIAFTILDAIRAEDRTTVTELAEELNHSKSTIHSHVQTLQDQEIIVRDGDGYRLSLQVLDMANDVRNQVGNHSVIAREVEELATETSEIAHFGLEEHESVAYLCKASSDRAVETASRVGGKQPIHSTSLGKAILSAMPAAEVGEIVRSIDFERKTPNTITNAEDFLDELDHIADQGYAIDDEENLEGVRCIAAPVRRGESVPGAISVTGPFSRMSDERLHGDLAESVQRAANVIELNTKFS